LDGEVQRLIFDAAAYAGRLSGMKKAQVFYDSAGSGFFQHGAGSLHSFGQDTLIDSVILQSSVQRFSF
jgi:hypothetical protein